MLEPKLIALSWLYNYWTLCHIHDEWKSIKLFGFNYFILKSYMIQKLECQRMEYWKMKKLTYRKFSNNLTNDAGLPQYTKYLISKSVRPVATSWFKLRLIRNPTYKLLFHSISNELYLGGWMEVGEGVLTHSIFKFTT